MDTTAETVATWGYKPDGAARIFDLAPGEALPEGWHASPDCITDPALATSDALSARLQGREYVPARAEADPAAEAPAGALEAAVAEIERLKGIIEAGTAENEKLHDGIETIMADNEALGLRVEAAQADLAKAAGEITELKALLDKAQADGGFAVSERDEAKAALDALKAELDQTRADLEAATAPKAEPAKKGR